jgi:glycosyltransferase involved in cell wall biosynthesis
VHLTALVDSPDHVCCRYRLAAYRPALERAGHCLDLVSLPRDWWSRIRLFRRLRGATVILQRALLPGWQLALLRRSVERLIFDFDDAVFLRDSYASKGHHDRRRLRRFAAIVRASDLVIAGNSYLADQAARWVGLARVRQIPTCVDPESYPEPSKSPGTTGTELVWIGSSSTLQGLERIVPLLERLGRAIPGLRLKLVCDRFLALKHLPVVSVPWSDAVEVPALTTADVGISWVPDDPWSRGKCGLKVLQYMAARLPVVCNPVGVHGEMVRHFQNGFLAQTEQEWESAVSQLARDARLRRQMGLAGRFRVEIQYSVAIGASAWLEVVNRLKSQRTGIAG